jgi:hypothetical protein
MTSIDHVSKDLAYIYTLPYFEGALPLEKKDLKFMEDHPNEFDEFDLKNKIRLINFMEDQINIFKNAIKNNKEEYEKLIQSYFYKANLKGQLSRLEKLREQLKRQQTKLIKLDLSEFEKIQPRKRTKHIIVNLKKEPKYEEYVLNPYTNRYILKNGKTHQNILMMKKIEREEKKRRLENIKIKI